LRFRCGQIELSFASFPIKSPRNVMETNYKIIGGDGREYGPVTLDEIKAWIRDGRIGRTTQIWRSDLGTWLPAAQYQELELEIAPLVGTAAEAHSELEAVGFWPRVGAYILDQLILGVISYLIFGSPQTSATSFPEIWTQLGTRLGFNLLISTLYYVGMNGSIGATLGKMVIGARIVNADGSKIGFFRAFLRMLASIVSSLTLGIGYLIVAFRDDKRALHDLIAGTRVVYKR
ncbi:MAG: RDD family protein, partial [Verrucomicrobiota bacterium]